MTTQQPAAGFFAHRRRWLIVALLFCFSVASNFDRQTLSVLAPTLKTTLGFGSVEYSYVVTSFLVAYTLGYVFAGRMLDRFGVRLCLAAALGFWTVVSMAHAAAAGWVSLVGLRFLLGLGESFNTPGGIKAISEWVPSGERGLSVAILNNGYVWGAILATPIVAFITLYLDWRLAFILPGFVSFLLLVAWWKAYDSPERHPRISAEERAYVLANRDTGAAGATPEKAPGNLLFHPLCIAFFCARFFTDPWAYFFNFWLPDYFAQSRGFSLAMLGLIGWLPFLAGDVGGPGGRRPLRLDGAPRDQPAPSPVHDAGGRRRPDALGERGRANRHDVDRGGDHRPAVRRPYMLDGQSPRAAFGVVSPQRGGDGDLDLGDRRLARRHPGDPADRPGRRILWLRAGVHRDERTASHGAGGDFARFVSQTQFAACRGGVTETREEAR